MLRALNLGVQRGNDALRPPQLQPCARHFRLQRHQRVVTLLYRRFLLRFGSLYLSAHLAPQVDFPLRIEAPLVKIDRLRQRS